VVSWGQKMKCSVKGCKKESMGTIDDYELCPKHVALILAKREVKK